MENPGHLVILLAGLAGIVKTLDRASQRNLGDKISFSAILTVAVILGPLGGILSLYIFAWLLRGTGKWLGGQAELPALRAAIAWASVPLVATLLLLVPELILVGPELFTKETPRLEANRTVAFVFLGLVLVEFALSIWTVVLLCKTVAEVQGFGSAWRGLGNILLAGLVIIVPILLIGILLFLVLR